MGFARDWTESAAGSLGGSKGRVCARLLLARGGVGQRRQELPSSRLREASLGEFSTFLEPGVRPQELQPESSRPQSGCAPHVAAGGGAAALARLLPPQLLQEEVSWAPPSRGEVTLGPATPQSLPGPGRALST